jgi:uncharacterized protein (DUF1015 family)
MPRVYPFEALIYDTVVAGPLDRVTTPPYDVISEKQRREYFSRPYNIGRVDLAAVDADLAVTTDRYEQAGVLLRRWIVEGVLVQSPLAFHAYEMHFGSSGRVRGVMCALELEDWGGDVLPHERTMDGPIEDRLRLLRATNTQLSAVYGAVAGPCSALADLLDKATAEPPDAEMLDAEGVIHRRWAIAADAPIGSWLAEEPILIADGHHRYVTALAFRDEMRAAKGPGPWDRLLTFVVDAGSEHLSVRPFHRIQFAGPILESGVPVDGLEAALADLSDDELHIAVARRTERGVELRVAALTGEPPAVRALHAGPLSGVTSPDALRFTPDAAEAVEAVRIGKAVAAYLLPPTTPGRIRKVVERGERLPQKSTYFWPKPRTGMVMMPLDHDAHA